MTNSKYETPRTIIALSGIAGVGKDTVATEVRKLLPGVGDYIAQLSFSDPLKAAAQAFFGLPDNLCWPQTPEDREQRDQPLPAPFEEFNAREVLQKMGTESLRNVFGIDIHVKAIEDRITALPPEVKYVLLTDCRFNNEANFIHSYNIRPPAHHELQHVTDGLVVQLEKPSTQHIPWVRAIRTMDISTNMNTLEAESLVNNGTTKLPHESEWRMMCNDFLKHQTIINDHMDGSNGVTAAYQLSQMISSMEYD